MSIQFIAVKNNLYGHYRQERRPDLKTSFHYHNGYELYYALSGLRNYLSQNEIYPLKQGWVTLTRPYAIHGTSGSQYERLLINFTEEFLSTYFQPPLIEIFHEVFSVEVIPANIIEQQPRIKELFYLIIASINKNDMNLAAVYLSELLLLLHEIVQNLSFNQETNSSLSLQMQAILAYISKNFATIKTIDQVAEHFYFSKHHLFHLFKQTGFSFNKFLTKQKISHAQYLLTTTKDTVSNISNACGFESPTYFNIVFKKQINMTPLQYRTWIKAKNKSSTKSPEK